MRVGSAPRGPVSGSTGRVTPIPARVVVAGVVWALAGWPAEATGNPWSLFGLGARAKGMGQAHTAAARDYSAVFYNPAALTEIEEGAFAFDGSWVLPELTLDFDAPPQLEPRTVEDAPGLAFGAQLLLGEPEVRGRVGLGIAIHVPTQSLLSGRAVDPARPQWYLYESLPRRIVASLGFGWAPWRWLSVGASVQILAGVSGRLNYELDLVAGRFVEKTVIFDIEPVSAPTVGFEVRPVDGLRIAGTWRGGIGAEVDLPLDIEVTELAELLVTTQFPIQFSPDEVALGVSWRVPEVETLVAGDLTWLGWSAAPDPSPETRLDASGDLIDGTGLGGAFDAPAPGQSRAVDLGLRDVVTIAVGVEQPVGRLRLRGGYRLSPTPVPVQTTGTNYVDVTVHAVSVGMGVRFSDPTEALTGPIELDAAAAAAFLPSRRHEKAGLGDPVGSYGARGTIFSLGLALRYVFEPHP